jgi:NADH oxidase (H2O2-forming)
MRPNTEFVIDSGIEIGKYRGINVNAKMETNIDDVYACGDCVETKDVVTGEDRLSLLWHTAMLQGYVAGCNSLEVSKIYPGSLNFTVVEVFEKYAVSSGNTFEELMKRKPKIIEVESDETYKKLIVLNDRIIGLQIIGEYLSSDISLTLGAIRRRESITHLEEII